MALVSNYSFSTSLKQSLLQSCSNLFLNFSFHYSLNEVSSSSSFRMWIIIGKCSFLTNDLARLKKLTLAINYLFLFLNECTSTVMNSFHLFFIFFSTCLYTSLNFLNNVFLLQLRSMIC